MAENMSLADQAVQALAAVKAMDAEITNEHPQRHSVRALRRMAEETIATALRQAIHLAWLAKNLGSMVDEVRLEEAKRAQAGER